jgi:amino acid transporter
VTALAIFSSDALSSVAYATQEMLITMFLAGAAAAAAFSMVVPLSLVIVGVLAILMFSYRQTIKAYPSAGGAYIVTKDNFGLLPAQVAGVALLTDYVLTVAVSVSAGVAAIIAAFNGLAPLRVPLAVLFIVLIALGNLRGVKESGKIFAAPTYLFIFMVVTLIGIGILQIVTGTAGTVAEAPAYVAGWMEEAKANAGTFAVLTAIPLGLALHALASGSAAMTGVEAISNGVPAFRPPEWQNARRTLMWMGTTLGAMFLGISVLAQHLRAVPDPSDKDTVLAEIGRTVFGASTAGQVAFYVLQAATMLILVLAANTAFADFPRLANFHADDAFLPRQFTTRGHRLVFSNGIVALAAAATILVVAFGADVTHLIPFYAIGVFTSFTLSQAGMARHHLRLKEPGWRVGLIVNGLGAIATAILLMVIATTKFWHGAWAVIVLVPIMVYLLVRMNRQYEREQRELNEDLEAFSRRVAADGLTVAPLTVLMVDAVDPKTIHALQYAKTIRARDLVAVHIEDDPVATVALESAWSAAGLGEVPLRVLRGEGDDSARLAGFVGGLPPDRQINVLMPVPHEPLARERISEAREGTRLTRALLPYDQVRVTLVRDHPDGVHPLQVEEDGRATVKLVPRGRHRVVVAVDKLDRAVLRSIAYAMTLGTDDVRAVHAAVDPDKAMKLASHWMEVGVPIPLDVIECWNRDVAGTLEDFVLERRQSDVEVTLVMSRRDFPRMIQRLLHDRTANRIQQRLGRYPHLDIASVPYYFSRHPDAGGAPPGAR